MHSESREQLVVVVAGLLGVVTGQWLRSLAAKRSEPTQEDFGGLDIPTLTATPALAYVAGEVIGIDEEALPARAVVTFGTGAALAFFADHIGRRLPGVLPGDSAAKE
jgi:hypothetical protein